MIRVVPDGEEILLALPTRPEYGRVARIAAAHLALRRGYTLTEIDDLRLAVDETAILLLGSLDHTNGDESRWQVTYSVDGDDVVIEARVEGVATPALPAADVERFAAIATGLVDDLDIDVATRRVRLHKTHHG